MKYRTKQSVPTINVSKNSKHKLKKQKMTFLKIFFPAILILLQLMIYPLNSFAEELVVIRPQSESASDSRYDYHWEVLEAALAATRDEGPYVIRIAEILMTERRCLEELLNKRG